MARTSERATGGSLGDEGAEAQIIELPIGDTRTLAYVLLRCLMVQKPRSLQSLGGASPPEEYFDQTIEVYQTRAHTCS